MITSQMDRRGKHAPSHKISDETKAFVESHIESFYPAVPHYHRAHAPFRRYLPPELTIKVMFNHCKEVNPLVKCQERSYRRFLNKMNIGFGKLGDEECENCHAFSLHEHDSKETSDADSERCSVEYNPPPDLLEAIDSSAATLLKDSGIELKENCSLCSTWKLHATCAKICREEYRWDVQRNEKNSGAIYFACDMEKVIMCPRFPGMKRVIFTRRIILFHETFAPLGGGEKKRVIAMKILQALMPKLLITLTTEITNTLFSG